MKTIEIIGTNIVRIYSVEEWKTFFKSRVWVSEGELKKLTLF